VNEIKKEVNKMVNKVKKDWEFVAKESMNIEQIRGTIYAYCSELAALRLYKYYGGHKDVRANYSENLQTWYFSLDLNM